ncbi:MAG TPA: hypothetical protein VF452_03755, partial [Candidatus Binatia bacterium]
AWAWILTGFCILAVGVAVYVFNLPQYDKLVGFLAALGLVYFVIGAVLSVMHDRHMDKRTRAGLE